MRQGLAPYGAVLYTAEHASCEYDRHNYRLMRRLWSACNRGTNPPLLTIWQIHPVEYREPSLPFVAGEPDWLFLRAVSGTVWWISTNNGWNLLEDLRKKFPESPSYEQVKAWFETRDHHLVHRVVHECVPGCRTLKLVRTVGFSSDVGYACEIESATEEAQAAFYSTFTWLCSSEGLEFTKRFQAAYSRLYTLPGART